MIALLIVSLCLLFYWFYCVFGAWKGMSVRPLAYVSAISLPARSSSGVILRSHCDCGNEECVGR
jgi:hypothetical protein